jgi:hypothetical protein
MKILNDIKNPIAIIILAIVICAIVIFLGRPLINSCLDIYIANKDKNVEITSYDKNIQNLQGIETKVADISYTIQKAAEFIPSEENIGDFIVQLEATSKKSDITLTSITIEKIQETNQSQPTQQNTNQEQGQTSSSQSSSQTTPQINVQGVKQKIILVEAGGNYPNLVTFLSRMHRLSRFNIIKNLSLKSAEKGGEVTASFYLIIFSKS